MLFFYKYNPGIAYVVPMLTRHGISLLKIRKANAKQNFEISQSGNVEVKLDEKQCYIMSVQQQMLLFYLP